MTLFSRLATIATMSFAIAGLIGTSTPGRAADLTIKPLLTTPTPNDPAAPVVPASLPPVEQDAPAENAIKREFASLSAAVAAQDAVATDDAVRCLAGAIYFESKGEPLSGQLAVAQVIINRSKSGRFAPDVCGVVTQRGQFSFVRGGRIPAVDGAHAAYRTAVAVARVALADMWDGAAESALYFNTPNRVPASRLRRIAAIGNHVFYR